MLSIWTLQQRNVDRNNVASHYNEHAILIKSKYQEEHAFLHHKEAHSNKLMDKNTNLQQRNVYISQSIIRCNQSRFKLLNRELHFDIQKRPKHLQSQTHITTKQQNSTQKL